MSRGNVERRPSYLEYDVFTYTRQARRPAAALQSAPKATSARSKRRTARAATTNTALQTSVGSAPSRSTSPNLSRERVQHYVDAAAGEAYARRFIETHCLHIVLKLTEYRDCAGTPAMRV